MVATVLSSASATRTDANQKHTKQKSLTWNAEFVEYRRTWCIRKNIQMIENFLLYHFVKRKRHYRQKTTAEDGRKKQCWLSD